MAILTEGRREGEYVIEFGLSGWLSNMKATALGAAMEPGTVLEFNGTDYVPVTALGTAVAILWGFVDDAITAQEATVTYRDTDVNGADLIWPAGFNQAAIDAAIVELAAVGIRVREVGT